MPKQSKSKKQSKVKRSVTWIRPTSRAKGALLFVLVFGVVGGIYMTYSSFAATTGTKTYAYSLFSGSNSGCGLSNIKDTQSSQKSGTSVMKLDNDGCTKYGWTTYATADEYTGVPKWSSTTPVNAKLCIYVRGDVGAGDNKSVYATASTNGVQLEMQPSPTAVKGSKDYQKICSTTKRIPAGASNVGLYIANGDTQRDLYFAWSSIEYTPVP